ncbi:hypothetical protein AB1N83_010997 [Pleurotus pulmonarius]
MAGNGILILSSPYQRPIDGFLSQSQSSTHASVHVYTFVKKCLLAYHRRSTSFRFHHRATLRSLIGGKWVTMPVSTLLSSWLEGSWCLPQAQALKLSRARPHPQPRSTPNSHSAVLPTPRMRLPVAYTYRVLHRP